MSWGLVMLAPLSRDLRERIVAAIRDGSSMRGAAARFSVSPSSAIKLMARFRATGRRSPIEPEISSAMTASSRMRPPPLRHSFDPAIIE